MIGYTTLGTNDFERAKTFYDAVLGELGARRSLSYARMQLWRSADRLGMLAVCVPFDGRPATCGNGTMVALAAPSHAVIDKVYARAMASGAADEGAPGDRGDGFYGAYFRDLDGNKLCVFKLA